jgi:hypothetical protein
MKKLILSIITVILLTGAALAEDNTPKNNITAQLNFNFPTGVFGDFWGTGLGAVIQYERLLTNEISVGISTGYIFWKPETDPGNTEFLFTDIPVALNLRYYFPSAGSFTPYAMIEGGIHNTSSETDYGSGAIDTDTGSDIGFMPAFGIIMPFGNNIFINVNAAYTIIMSGEDNTTHFGFNGGISIPF